MLQRAVLFLAGVMVLAIFGGDSQAAPSGPGRIAFQSGDSGLCVMDVDGSNRSCTNVAGQIGSFEGCVAFSPDGRSIVFDYHGLAGYGLYVMNVDASHLRRLIEPPEVTIAGPVFSSDGHKIVFTSIFDRILRLYMMDVDGTHLIPLTDSGGISVSGWNPAFSPDGRKIAFAAGGVVMMGIVLFPSAIYVINADGAEMKRLTEPPISKQSDMSLGDRDPAFSPDGRKIVFDRGATAIPGTNSRLYMIDIDGSHITVLTDPPGGDSHPAFSLDGRKIVFSSTRGNTDPSQGAQLYVMNTDGSHMTRLTEPPGWARCPVFIR